MESFLNRYRNITVLLLVIFAQLVLLALQVKNDQDVRFIRIWTVTAVTPVARVIEMFRGGGLGFVRNYVMPHDANAENRRLQTEVGRLKMENIFLKGELNHRRPRQGASGLSGAHAFQDSGRHSDSGQRRFQLATCVFSIAASLRAWNEAWPW